MAQAQASTFGDAPVAAGGVSTFGDSPLEQPKQQATGPHGFVDSFMQSQPIHPIDAVQNLHAPTGFNEAFTGDGKPKLNPFTDPNVSTLPPQGDMVAPFTQAIQQGKGGDYTGAAGTITGGVVAPIVMGAAINGALAKETRGVAGAAVKGAAKGVKEAHKGSGLAIPAIAAASSMIPEIGHQLAAGIETAYAAYNAVKGATAEVRTRAAVNLAKAVQAARDADVHNQINEVASRMPQYEGPGIFEKMKAEKSQRPAPAPKEKLNYLPAEVREPSPPVPAPQRVAGWKEKGITNQLPPPPEAVQPITPNIPTRRATIPAGPPPAIPPVRTPAWQQQGSTGERPPTIPAVESITPPPYVAKSGRGLSSGILDSISQWKTGKNFNQLTPDEVKMVTDLAAKVKPSQPQAQAQQTPQPSAQPASPSAPTSLPPPPGSKVEGLKPGHMAVKQHQVLSNVDQAIENKVANIHDYLVKNGITNVDVLDKMTPQQLNDLAKEAHSHGKSVGNPVPKYGYKGLEGDSLQMVKDRLRGIASAPKNGLAPPPQTSQ